MRRIQGGLHPILNFTPPDCPVVMPPSIWHSHLSLHTSGKFSGAVSVTWLHGLQEQDLFICSLCHQLVSNTTDHHHTLKGGGGGSIFQSHILQPPLKLLLPVFPIRAFHGMKRFSSCIVPLCVLLLPGRGQPLLVFCQLL